MKKVLAIVLAIAMIFSFGSVAFARDFAADETGIWFGPKTKQVAANQGETASFVVEFKTNLLPVDNIITFEDMGEVEIDKEGTLVIPFYIMVGDQEATPLQSVALTDAAKTAGIELVNQTEELVGEGQEELFFVGSVKMPASVLYSTDAIDVLNVTVAENGEWIIDEDYGEAENPKDITFYAGMMGMTGENFYIISNEGTDEEYITYLGATLVENEGGASVQITSKLYEPTKKERRTEWWRSLAVKILEFNNKVIDFMMNKVFAPAKWYVA